MILESLTNLLDLATRLQPTKRKSKASDDQDDDNDGGDAVVVLLPQARQQFPFPFNGGTPIAFC